MRKPILMSAMLLMSVLAFAQTQQGQVQLGGVFNFNRQDLAQGETLNLNIVPQAGYFVSDLTSLGLTFNISSSDLEAPGFNQERNLFEFGVFARFHKSVTDKFYLYLQPSLSFGSGESEISGNPTVDINTTSIRVSPGAMYFVTPKIAMEMRVGSLFYEQIKETTGGNEEKITGYGLLLNLTSVSIGASFFLQLIKTL